MNIPPIRLLHETLIVSAERLPDKTALIAEGKSYSYSQLLHAAQCIAQTLVQKGLCSGDRVAIYQDNTFSCVAALYGILMAGGVFLIINPQTKSDKLAFILDDSDAKFLMTEGHFFRNFVSILPNLHKLSCVIYSGTITAMGSIWDRPLLRFDDVINAKPQSQIPVSTISINLSALIYTSGSTGNPKGVMMTHQSMIFTVGSLIQYLRLSENHRILNVLPLAFDYGLYQLIMSVSLGATLVLERSFTYTAQILKRIVDCAVTVFPGVPTIYSMLIQQHKKNKIIFPSIQRITNTAAALPADYQPFLREIFPNALIYRMYGLTECKRVCYLEPELADKKPLSVGKAIPGTEIFLLSADGQPVSPGEIGILHIRGTHVMRGYWKQPELSAKMLKPGLLPGEFILCSHDWFKMDEDGDLYFLGRSDDIIKTRGEKVSPIEVENALYSITGIKEAAVIGIPDPLLGEAVKAFVALADECTLTEKEIQKICSTKLENFMVPKSIEFLQELPKTDTGKIKKKALPHEYHNIEYHNIEEMALSN